MALTYGAVRAINDGGHPSDVVLQIIDLKRLDKGQAPKYKVILSDGTNYQHGVLSSQLCHLVDDGRLKQYSIVKLGDYSCNVVKDRRVVIVLILEVVDNTPVAAIGNPTPIDVVSSGSGDQTASASAAAPQSYSAVSVPPPSSSYAPAPTGGFGGSSASSYGQPQPQRTSAPVQIPTASFQSPAPTSKKPIAQVSPSGIGAESIQPISSLNMYQPRWAIRARVSSKGPVKKYTNQRGAGKLLSLVFVDEHGGEIRATMFNEAVDKFGDLLEVDNVYNVSKGQIKHANKKFSNINNDYEITLDERSVIELVHDDGRIPRMQFNFVAIDELPQRPEETLVDILGVVQSVGDCSEIVSKRTQQPVEKRNVVLADQSSCSVDLTIWGNNAVTFDGKPGDIVAFKEVRVSSFNGRSLSCMGQSTVLVDPKIEEAYALRGFWQSNQGSMQLRSISQGAVATVGGSGGIDRAERRKTLSAITEEHLGFGERPDWLTVRGTVTVIRHDRDMWYFAKKSTQREDGTWAYEKCDPHDPEAERRYLVNLQFSDHTASQWVTAFDAAAHVIMQNVSPNDLASWKEADPDLYSSTLNGFLFRKYVVKLRTKAETVNGERRTRTVATNVAPLDYSTEGKSMVEDIRRMLSA